ncbi:hypothetical protein GIB67_029853 [Kingdonia uniflora]|uniref:Disease resistance R13L4/SHOC-2-like LRR domain-containing protein n=1 Tax=Kingdonia uniflora TaxID=39325 RepID=A0A7J7NJ57_9MAGN|nr:hypothetical protein GIB67_029853 [Kingdonia uniflora]
MLQVDEKLTYVGLRACKLHDLMRDIVIHMLHKEEFGVIFKNQSNNILTKGVRHVAFLNASFGYLSSKIGEVKARTLLTFAMSWCSPSMLHQMIVSFKLLRVLDLSGTNIKNFSSVVCDLIHLQYLSLRTQVGALPASLHRLQSLQTIDLRNTLVREFPPGIELAIFPKLRNNNGFLRDQKNNKSLMNLQTLRGVVGDEILFNQLHHSTKLQKLYVDMEDFSWSCDIIEEMRKLWSLKVTVLGYGYDNCKLELENIYAPPPYLEKLHLIVDIMGGYLPEWIRSLAHLRVLKLGKSRVVGDPLETLAHLPNLERIQKARLPPTVNTPAVCLINLEHGFASARHSSPSENPKKRLNAISIAVFKSISQILYLNALGIVVSYLKLRERESKRKKALTLFGVDAGVAVADDDDDGFRVNSVLNAEEKKIVMNAECFEVLNVEC